MSESVMNGDYPIIAIETTAKINEQMISESYTAAALSVDNPDVITHLSDQQIQVFMRTLARLCGEAEQAEETGEMFNDYHQRMRREHEARTEGT